MEESKKIDFSLVAPFWVDTAGYSDRDREMFVCGVEYHMIYLEMQECKKSTRSIHVENESRVKMLAKKLECKIKLTPYCNQWTTLEIL